MDFMKTVDDRTGTSVCEKNIRLCSSSHFRKAIKDVALHLEGIKGLEIQMIEEEYVGRSS